jgi:hypothetical protein
LTKVILDAHILLNMYLCIFLYTNIESAHTQNSSLKQYFTSSFFYEE